MALMGFYGAWGKLIDEKNLKSKISWHCTLVIYITKVSSSKKHVVPVWSLHFMVGRKSVHQLVENSSLNKKFF